MTEEEKYHQIRKEAAFTGIALLVLILFWLAAGFGMAQMEGEVLGLPVWVVASSIGVWFMAILLVKFLTRSIFRDMPLEDDGASAGNAPEVKRDE